MFSSLRSGTASNRKRKAESDETQSSNCRPKATVVRPGYFESVLDRPFGKWNECDNVIAIVIPEWSDTQRGCILRSLFRFLELKVVLEECIPESMLAPTDLVASAWKALLLETKLYKKVTGSIQMFHGQERKAIHHSIVDTQGRSRQKEKIARAQSLCECYYGERMPVCLEDTDADDMSDTSTLTDWMGPARLLKGAMGWSPCASAPPKAFNEPIDFPTETIQTERPIKKPFLADQIDNLADALGVNSVFGTTTEFDDSRIGGKATPLNMLKPHPLCPVSSTVTPTSDDVADRSTPSQDGVEVVHLFHPFNKIEPQNRRKLV